MLVSLTKVLRAAQHGRYAVGAFNTSNLEVSQAIVAAAEAMRAPVIIQTSEGAIDYGGMEQLKAIVVSLAEAATVPVVFHLDHGRDRAVIKKAITGGGYTSAMVDGANLEFEANLELTNWAIGLAHRRGISIEAEIGAVGGAEDHIKGRSLLTVPAEAHEFARRTHCDAIAVGIGNNHGKPTPDETLHLDLLQQIRDVVDTPLVLHGASSTPEDLIKSAIKIGITKINIDTDLRVAWSDAERQEFADDKAAYDPRKILAPARKAVEETVKHKIALFGSQNKAKDV